MIRNIIFITGLLFMLAACAANKKFETSQTFAPAQFEVSDVYVNMVDGIEDSSRIRKMMSNAGINTANLYNDLVKSDDAELVEYPLELEVTDVYFRDPKASLALDERTYIRYSATLREEDQGIIYRSLPITFYLNDVAITASSPPDAKRNATNAMIRNSIKYAFSSLYGMSEISAEVESYFSTHDILSDPKNIKKKSTVNIIHGSQVTKAKPKANAGSDQVLILAPDENIVERTTTEDGITVLKCAIC